MEYCVGNDFLSEWEDIFLKKDVNKAISDLFLHGLFHQAQADFIVEKFQKGWERVINILPFGVYDLDLVNAWSMRLGMGKTSIKGLSLVEAKERSKVLFAMFEKNKFEPAIN